MGHLTIYLNDHLAGSTAGIELAKRSLRSNRGTAFEEPLERLVAEIGEDRDSLRSLMARLGVPRQAWKATAGFLAEKLGRLKLNGHLFGYSSLGRLLEFEFLQLGVEGKAELWRALQTIADREKRLDREELANLERRAQRQRRRLQDLHRAAAALAFD